jgi:AraC-like DNA-binding protein
MSYELGLLFQKISVCINTSPSVTLRDLSRSLHVSRQTIEKAVYLATDRTFKRLRDEILLTLVERHFAGEPIMAIKEVSFAVGFKSASSFARTIKRVCGCSPEELRSRVARALQVASKGGQLIKNDGLNRSEWGVELTPAS